MASEVDAGMEELYRLHGAMEAPAEDDLSLLPAGMTMAKARRLVDRR